MKNNPELALALYNKFEPRFQGTEALRAALAEGLREKIEELIRVFKERLMVLDRLQAKVKNLLLNKMFKEALDIIYADRGYVKHKEWVDIDVFVKEIEELLRKQKAEEGGGGGKE